LRILALIAIILLLSFILSIIALQTVYEDRTDEIEIDLSNGVYEPIYSIYGYPIDVIDYNASLDIVSKCPCTVNVSLIKFKSLKNYTCTSTSFILEPYDNLTDIEIEGLDTILVIEPHNCSLIARIRYTIEYRPYLILAIPSFILLLVATVLLINIILGRGIARISKRET